MNLLTLSELYLLQGVYFEKGQNLILGFDKRGESGVFVHTAMHYHMYYGLLAQDLRHGMGAYTGHMRDNLGEALLYNARITDCSFIFSKKYSQKKPHEYIVEYELERVDDLLWAGTWKIPARGLEGTTNCRLAPITPNFFQPPAT